MQRTTAITLAVLIVLGLLSLAMAINQARAHSDGHMQYDQDCCSGQDCAPVIRSELVVPSLQASMYSGSPMTPTRWVETIHGKGPILQNTKRRDSKDSRFHACILQGAVICIYEPPGF